MQIENPGENPRRRTLLLALEQWEAEMKRLPFNHPQRGEVARKIVQIEDELTGLGDA